MLCVYIRKLEAEGVRSFIQVDEHHLTGSSIVLVTPDSARTMNRQSHRIFAWLSGKRSAHRR